jgi:hypothetical protein
MNTQHFDIGTIQAFLDGELAHERVAEVSSHIGACDDCARMLGHAEDESAFVFSALESEFNTLVPTHRLWGKINDSIQVEKRNAPFWQKALAFVRASLANPSMTAMAGMILVLGAVALVFLNRTPNPEEVATVTRPAPEAATTTSVAPAAVMPQDITQDRVADTESFRSGPRPERASYQPSRRAESIPIAAHTQSQVSEAGYLPGEESYVKTIETLAKTVETDNSMRGSERVAFERDLAVVNDSISKLRAQVRKNPKNESAKQVLYSSYQNKIDLLNSVSQKEELMASIGTR